jgi:sulfur-oxidizing protein SoxX
MQCLGLAAFLLALSAAAASAQEGLRSYIIVGDSIPDSLTGQAGDATRGRSVVANRSLGMCLLCHSAPLPEEPFQGNLASNLAGAGSRWSAGQLRLRIVDPSRLEARTIMPSYYRIDHLQRVAKNFADRPILTAQQVEDVVAYLATLKE